MRIGQLGFLLAGTLLAGCPDRPGDTASQTTTATLDLIQQRLREHGWDTPDVPRENLQPGALVARSPSGIRYLSNLADCTDPGIVSSQKMAAGLPTVEYTFHFDVSAGVNALNLGGLQLTASRVRRFSVVPKTLEIWSLSTANMRKAIIAKHDSFTSLCMPDFTRRTEGEPLVIIEALVAKSIELDLRDETNAHVDAKSVIPNTPLTAIAGPDWKITAQGTLENDNANLVLGFRTLPAMDVVPLPVQTNAPAPASAPNPSADGGTNGLLQ